MRQRLTTPARKASQIRSFFSYMESPLAKYKKLLVAISPILEYLEELVAWRGSKNVYEKTFLAAFRLREYFESHAVRVYDNSICVSTKAAHDLIEHILLGRATSAIHGSGHTNITGLALAAKRMRKRPLNISMGKIIPMQKRRRWKGFRSQTRDCKSPFCHFW
jgi:hypothetical protein